MSSTPLDEVTSFFTLPEVAAITAAGRLDEVRESIQATGTYEHTWEELLLRAKIAWRNHARCSGRASWRLLQLNDARKCQSAEEIAAASWEHMRLSTNGGRLRAMITIFRPRLADGSEVEIINPQLIRYAGHRSADGSVVGDPLHIELTALAQHLGWRGAGTPFDILPIMIRVDGGPVQLFHVPQDAILEVPLVHPRYD